ncbi:hypothetical protein BDZ89DRAFT_1069631 [Hymenopellis radicata]|nr:hypothetical protein BDZ89DRAFT_1069631 [Hymenopellis radicata]
MAQLRDQRDHGTASFPSIQPQTNEASMYLIVVSTETQAVSLDPWLTVHRLIKWYLELF